MTTTSNGFDRRAPTSSRGAGSLRRLHDHVEALAEDSLRPLMSVHHSSDLGSPHRYTIHFSGSLGSVDIVPALLHNVVAAASAAAEMAHAVDDLLGGDTWLDALDDEPTYASHPQHVRPDLLKHLKTAAPGSEGDELAEWYSRLDDDR